MFPSLPLRLPWKWPFWLTIALSTLAMLVLLGSFFYVRSQSVLRSHLRETLKTTAALSAMQFDAAEIETIHSPSDRNSPAFRNLVRRLQEIRKNSTSVRYAYIMRRMNDRSVLQFVADADSLASDEDLDANANGTVDENEEASQPGDAYDISDIPALQQAAFLDAAVDLEATIDQWGSLISGYAPIRDANGRVVAILGIDMDASDFLALSHSVMSPTLLLLIVCGAWLFAGFLAFFLWHRRLDMLEEVEVERSALIDLTLHQLGAPLATFKWWLELLKELPQKPKYKDADICSEMQEGIVRMDSIMTSLRQANRVRKGELPYNPEIASVADIVNDVRNIFENRLSPKKQVLEIAVDTCDRQLNVDRKLIAAVLGELIDNASTYSPAESTIRILSSCGRTKAQVEVRDQGVGIPANELPRIFKKFNRGSYATRYKPVGNGLGLYIAKGIIDRAGGTMWVESKPGKGTSFFFTLPYAV